MQTMFKECKKFDQDLSTWNVENCKNMEDMFAGVTKFNQDLSRWNVENCTNMELMFERARKFKKNTIANWDLNGKTTRGMFKKGETGKKR